MLSGDMFAVGGITYVVLKKMGSGSQGSVWQVKSNADNKLYALKLINDGNPKRRRNKIENIERLISAKMNDRLLPNRASHGVYHMFPIVKYGNSVSGEEGYIMECASGKTLETLWKEGVIVRMKTSDKLLLAQKVAKAIDILHSEGYCYTDISWGNFMWDELTRSIYVIDCENAAGSVLIDNGACAFLYGTGFFIAPEVAFEQARVGYNSDRYALAAFIFGLLTCRVLMSPYHGVAMYAAQPLCQNMLEVAEYVKEGDLNGDWQHFVFDPNCRVNGIDKLCVNSKNPANVAFRKNLDEATALWNGLNDRLKKLFYNAFCEPFNVSMRPGASQWVRTIGEVLAGGAVSAGSGARAKGKVSAPAPTGRAAEAGKAAGKASPVAYPGYKPRGDAAVAQNAAVAYPTYKPRENAVNNTGAPVTYAEYKPAAHAERRKARLKGENTVIELGDETVVTGDALGIGDAEACRIYRRDGGYVLTCETESGLEIISADATSKNKLSKGQSRALLSGDAITAGNGKSVVFEI